ncbi:MAG: single-stranded DNA-binding protein [Weeksellaceae bacterium]|nr:single-stranded DNA-binding protein [Weeksellaceae bacterium]
MSGSLNKVLLIGNLGDEVKIHYFDRENCTARFSIATNEHYTNRSTGEKVVQTEWHRVVVKNKLAEICEKYLSKGDSVFVEGKLRTRKYDDHGTTKQVTEIVADNVNFLTTKGKGHTDSSSSQEFLDKSNLGDDSSSEP